MEQNTDTTVSLEAVCGIIRKEAWRLAIRPVQAQELIKSIKRNVKPSSDQSCKIIEPTQQLHNDT